MHSFYYKNPDIIKYSALIRKTITTFGLLAATLFGAYAQTAQTITFTSPNVGEPGGGRTIALLATATSVGTVTFAVTEVRDADGNVVTGVAADAVVTLSGTTLTLLAAGTVTITATQAGGDIGGTDYAEAMQTQVITLRSVATFRVTIRGDMDADGSSWGNAMTLQAALAASGLSGDQIWIEAGTYKPHADDRTATFTIPANVSVYGGFEGDEAADFDPATTARMGAATILSGDLSGDDLADRINANYAAMRDDNSHTVVTITGADVTLDGLTITAGEGGTFVPDDFSSFGAGLYAGSSTAGTVVRNCMFTNNASNDAHRVGEDFTIYFGGGAYFTENVTLIGCAFTGNIASLGGGAYFNQTTTLTNCTFTGNEASTEAGGVHFARDANLTNCVVANNASGLDAGGILLSGGTVINSTFYNNTATQRGGGIMVIVTDIDDDMAGVQSVPFNLQNSILVGNTATTAGNAIYLLDNFAPFNVTDIEATIDYNLIGGGEADLGVGTFNSSYTDLPLSDATNVVLSNTIEESDASAVFASIMAADDDFLRLKDTSPAVNAGNDAHISGILTDAAGDTRIQSSTVDLGAYESAFDAHQAITFTAPAVDITKAVAEVVPLIATTNAVGLFVSFTITTTPDTGVATLTDNGSTDGIGSLTLNGAGTVTVTASQTGGTTSGGTTYVAAADVIRTITVRSAGSIIFRVTDSGDASADGSSWENAMTLQAALEASGLSGDQIWIKQGTYKPHHADDRTATFAIRANVSVYGGFVGDEAADFDPATTARTGAATILSGDLSDDDLTDRENAGYAAMRDDNSHTVVTITGADVTLDGLTITAGEGGTEYIAPSGETVFVGAGLYGQGSTTTGTVINNCMFTTNNVLAGNSVGGGAYFVGEATLTDCIFTGNQTAASAGGAYFEMEATLTGCTFTGNITSNDGGNSAGGGAYFVGESTLTDCTFTDNQTAAGGGRIPAFGGGAYFVGESTLMDCIFTGNEAMDLDQTGNNGLGGGAYFRGVSTVTSSTFTDNEATGFGGGAYFRGVSTVTSSTFTDNEALQGQGGGASFRGFGTVTSSTFTGNEAGFGGGVACSVNVGLANCIFASNTAMGGGGLLLSSGGRVINTTFYKNRATFVPSPTGQIDGLGGGTLVAYQDTDAVMDGIQTNPLDFRNNILIGNTANGLGSQAYVYNFIDTDEVNIQNNLIANAGISYNTSSASGLTEANTVDESDAPVVFASTDIMNADFLRLVAGSPALNAGNNDYVNNATPRITTDAAGNPRIQDGTVDLGAYEGVPSTVQNITFADPTGGATVRVGETIDLVATTDAPPAAALPITFTSLNTDVAVVVPNMDGTFSLRFDGVGDVTITASQAGGDGADGITYKAATSVMHNITVLKGTQNIRFTSDGAGVVGSTITLVATATSTLPVTFEIESQTPSGVATLDTDTGVLDLLAAGDVVITATQSGDANYEAAPDVMQTIAVSATPLTSQTITFSPSATGIVGTDIVLAATATSTLPVTFAIESQVSTMGGSTIATLVGGNTLVLTGTGTVTITARQSGGRDSGGTVYEAAPDVMQTITVSKQTQTITFMSTPIGTVGEIIELMATASSGLEVTFAITTGDAFATLASNGTTLSLTGGGTVTITATQAGDANYAMTTETQDIVVSKQTQTIMLTTPATDITEAVRNVVPLMAMTNAMRLFVTFAITTTPATGVATLTDDGSTDGRGSLTLDGAGTVTVTASQDGNAAYAAATPVMRTITVEAVLGIEDATDNFVLYPNPTSGELRFSERVEEFRLFSIEGRLLETQKNVRSVDLAAWSVGLYFAEVIRGGQRTRYRIMRK